MRGAVDRQHRAERRSDGGGRRAAGAGAEERGDLVEEGADVGEKQLEEVLSCVFVCFGKQREES